MVHPMDCTGWPIMKDATVKVSCPAGDYTAQVAAIDGDVLVLRELRDGRRRYAHPSKVEVKPQRGTTHVPKPVTEVEGKPYENPFQRDSKGDRGE